MRTTMDASDALRDLRKANAAHAAAFPGDPSERQPVHTVYGGAQLYKKGVHRKLGQLALANLDAYAEDAGAFSAALGLSSAVDAELLWQRVRQKLAQEAIEDQRIDFEDGYGHRADAEEDGHAVAAAQELAKGVLADDLPPFIGIRVKPFTDESAGRGLRTLDLFLTALVEATGRRLPERFVVTLP